MALAYTPGLKVQAETTLRRTRRLPVPGGVIVQVGDKVSFDTVVARTQIQGDIQVINASVLMGVEADELLQYMKVKVGSQVKKDELLAFRSSLFGLMKSELRSPAEGTIRGISDVSGLVTLQEPPVPLEIDAYVEGTVVDVIPREGVVVETRGAIIQGIFGFGTECNGILQTIASESEEITADSIPSDAQGKILVGGSRVSADAVSKARSLGAKGIVSGGIRDADLSSCLGYDLGVAITGYEDIGLSVIVTEGFGKMNMSHRTYELLKSLQGKPAAISGRTQIRAGVIRPEIIVPHPPTAQEISADSQFSAGGLQPGMVVRVIRAPYFGLLGTIMDLIPTLERIESESEVRAMKLRLEDGRQVLVPRANVELIEH